MVVGSAATKTAQQGSQCPMTALTGGHALIALGRTALVSYSVSSASSRATCTATHAARARPVGGSWLPATGLPH